MSKVSIIIPVYNSEKYINKCIDSILNQTYSNLEIILVNDGSSDRSAEICYNYSINYKNIYLYNKKNGGTSEAKNLGIDKATGKFLLFIDSDDYIDNKYVENLIDAADLNNVDLVVAGYKVDYENQNYSIDITSRFNKIYNGYEEIREGILDLELSEILNVGVCKVYKNDIIKKFNLKFDVSLDTGEDLVFNCQYLKYIKNMKIIPNTEYHYVRRDTTSLVNKYKNNLLDMVNKCNTNRAELYKFYKMNDEKYQIIYRTTYIEYLAACIPNLFRENCKMNSKEKMNTINMIMSDVNLNSYLDYYNGNNKITLIFIKLCRLKNKYIAYNLYNLLFYVRNNMQLIYRMIRKEILSK